MACEETDERHVRKVEDLQQLKFASRFAGMLQYKNDHEEFNKTKLTPYKPHKRLF